MTRVNVKIFNLLYLINNQWTAMYSAGVMAGELSYCSVLAGLAPTFSLVQSQCVAWDATSTFLSRLDSIIIWKTLKPDFGWKQDHCRRRKLSSRASSLFLSRSCLSFYAFPVLIVAKDFLVWKRLFCKLVFKVVVRDAIRSISTYVAVNKVFSRYFFMHFSCCFQATALVCPNKIQIKQWFLSDF